LLLPAHDPVLGLLLHLLVSLLGFLAVILPMRLEELEDFFFDGFESFGFHFFESVLCFAHIGGLNLFVYLFSDRGRGHFVLAHVAVGVAHGVDESADGTNPLHDESLVLLFVLFFFFLFFLYFLHDFFLDEFGDVPAFDTKKEFVVFGENVELGSKDFSFVLIGD
jgi:hypothetical protein